VFALVGAGVDKSCMKNHLIEIIVAVLAMIGAIAVAVEGRFVLTLLFIAVALYCLKRITRTPDTK
jgi:hypothetical protein